jgi:hypothetical protein
MHSLAPPRKAQSQAATLGYSQRKAENYASRELRFYALNAIVQFQSA